MSASLSSELASCKRIVVVDGCREPRLLLADRLLRSVSTSASSFDADHPILNVRLPAGSRLSAMIPPVVGPEPLLNIRIFGRRQYSLDDLAADGTVTLESPGKEEHPYLRSDRDWQDDAA